MFLFQGLLQELLSGGFVSGFAVENVFLIGDAVVWCGVAGNLHTAGLAAVFQGYHLHVETSVAAVARDADGALVEPCFIAAVFGTEQLWLAFEGEDGAVLLVVGAEPYLALVVVVDPHVCPFCHFDVFEHGVVFF